MKKTLSFEKDLTFQTMIGEVTTISFEDDLKFVDQSDIEGNFYISGKYKMTEASTILEDFSFSVPISIAMIENYDLSTTKISILNFTYEIVDDDILRCKIDVLIEGVEDVILENEGEKESVETLEQKREDSNLNKQEEVEKPLSANKDHLTLLVKEDLKKDESIRENIEVEGQESNDCDGRECDGDMPIDEEKELPIKEMKESVTETGSKEDVSIKQVDVIEKKEEEESVQPLTEVVKEEKNTPSIQVNSLFSNLGDDGDTFTTYSVYIMRDGDTLEKVMDEYQVKKEDLEIYNDLSTIELNSKVIIPSSSRE